MVAARWPSAPFLAASSIRFCPAGINYTNELVFWPNFGSGSLYFILILPNVNHVSNQIPRKLPALFCIFFCNDEWGDKIHCSISLVTLCIPLSSVSNFNMENLESMHNIICITKRVQHQKVCNPCILLSHRQSASWNDLTCNTAGCLWVDLNIHIKRDEREREKSLLFCFHLLNFRFSEVKNISKDLNQEQLVSQLTLGASPGGHS